MTERFDRQRHLLGAGVMSALESARIAVYGLGGSGCPIVLQLAHLGVGAMTLVDPDVVDESNLNRQVLYGVADVGRPKTEAAQERVNLIAPATRVVTAFKHDVASMSCCVAECDVVIDAVDEYRFKVALDRECRRQRIPMIHVSAVGLRGTVATFTGDGPGYEVVFGLPSLGLPLDQVQDADFEERRRGLVAKLGASIYPPQLLAEIQERCLPWQTLVPAPCLAGSVAAAEVLRILQGQAPHFGPEAVFEFDLAIPSFGMRSYV